MEIDASKDVYLFVHGRSDHVEKSTAALVKKRFRTSEKIIQWHCRKRRAILWRYMAMLWISRPCTTITAVDSSVTKRYGTLAGVPKDVLFT